MTKRKVTQIESCYGSAIAKIHFCSEFQEYQVSFYIDRVKNDDATYYTDDKQDAINTANDWISKNNDY